MAQSKATKKYEKKHLSDTLKRRKDFTKVKQRHAVKAKKQSRKLPKVEEDDGKKKKVIEDMNVDEFFQSGMDIIDKKRKRDDKDESEDEEDDFDKHVEQLNNLKEKDPEFHKYLLDNDPELLDMDDVPDLEDIVDDEDDEESHTTKKLKIDNEVTSEMITKWEKSITELYSLKSSKEIIIAFKSAIHSTDDDNDKSKYKYSISNPEIYHQLLIMALNKIPIVLQHHLPTKEVNNKIKLSTESKKFSNMIPMIKSYFTSLIYLLNILTDPITIKMTLSTMELILPYILSFKKLLRDLIKILVDIWSISSYKESTRLASFIVIRKFMLIGDNSIKEYVLKSIYQGLIKGSKNTTIYTISGINLMKNSAAELFGLDMNIGYASGFNFIRQLAIHLRLSITNNSNESYKKIYNWQFIHSLDFWSRVVSINCNALQLSKKGQEKSSLYQLIYPIVQIIIGTIKLIPTSLYFPLRFHLCKSLLRISSNIGIYIPFISYLFEVLSSSIMKKVGKASSLKALNFDVILRCPKIYLSTRTYQDGLINELMELFMEFFGIWSKSISFPEMTIPFIIIVKRWLKINNNKNGKVNGQLILFIQKLESNIKFIEEKRLKVDYSPNNRQGVESFLKDVEFNKTPLGAFIITQRKIRDDKKKLLEQSRIDDEQRKKENKDKKEVVVDGEDDDDDDEDDSN